MAYVVLSLAYGTSFLLSAVHPPMLNAFRVKDTLALLFIVYTAKRYRGLTRVGGVPSLLNKIRQDATTYFLVLASGHILFLFFEVFAPVSDPVDLRATAHDDLHIGSDEASSWVVSPDPKSNEGESDRTRSYS